MFKFKSKNNFNHSGRFGFSEPSAFNLGNIIFMVIVFVFAGIMYIKFTKSTDTHAITDNAKKFMSETGISGNVSCTGIDSDGDGYVSCTIVSNGEMTPIECGYFINSGCRMTVPRINVNRNRY